MEAIDKLTLELLTNKTHYKRYLEKEEPKKYQEHQTYLEKIQKYKHKILNLSKEFLENPEKMFNTEMNEMFKIYSKTMIRYIELKEVERENLYHKDEESDEEEILFDSEKMESTNPVPALDVFSLEETLPRIDEQNSYWGTNIIKK
jgi:hypothetical protein